jgi:hypothetical protein
MDVIDVKAWQRVPLAEAVLTLWRFVADDERLETLFEEHRGRCYTKILQFQTMVRLMHDALVAYRGSGRASFDRAAEAGELPVSVRAAFGKLRRLPLKLSEAFLAEGSSRLREVVPVTAMRDVPPSLREFRVVILDGKAIKGVVKRLKPLRGRSGGVLGGRALVAMDFQCGQAVDMLTDSDGDANDVKFVSELVPRVRQRIPGPRLWMADRQFCDTVQPVHFLQNDDHFLVRYNKKVPFCPDNSQPAQRGQDASGRDYTEDRGWIGKANSPRRRAVRRITLKRPGEEDLVLLTDLLDGEKYLVADLLTLYAQRWGIEQMFQKVTEVFYLAHLIGGTPQATVFQFAFCLLLYNMIQTVRVTIAAAVDRDPETISLEKMFVDVEHQLIACTVMWDVDQLAKRVDRPWQASEVRQRLKHLLRDVWTDVWIKAKSYRRRPHPVVPRLGVHMSVHRILMEAKQKRATTGPQ